MNVQIRENQAVIAYLSRAGPKDLLVSPADSRFDPYLALGSHPDIVERLWHGFGDALSPESRQIVCGSPALVHPVSGIVFAIAIGTSYVLRLSAETVKAAKEAGFQTTHMWSNRTTTDIEQELGPGWIFGQWSPMELTWLVEAYGPVQGSA
jgi:hypothetical protein